MPRPLSCSVRRAVPQPTLTAEPAADQRLRSSIVRRRSPHPSPLSRSCSADTLRYDDEFADSLAELGRLAKTLGVEVVGQVTQKRSSFDPGAYLGPGKRTEIKPRIDSEEADTLLIDHEISPSQARNLEKETGADVLDRTAVILEIFHRHANTREARLQVEMARLKYVAPRMRESSAGGGRQQGPGAGESALALDGRKIRDRLAELKGQLEAIQRDSDQRRALVGDVQERVVVQHYHRPRLQQIGSRLQPGEVRRALSRQ